MRAPPKSWANNRRPQHSRIYGHREVVCPGRKGHPSGRTGAATLDYILVLGIILPLTAFLMTAGRRMIVLVYEMVCVLVSWPFM